MRKAILLRSIAQFLDDGTQVVEAAYMWKRHRLMMPFGIVSFLGMLVVAEWAGLRRNDLYDYLLHAGEPSDD